MAAFQSAASLEAAAPPPVLLLGGATASGKSALALRLAKAWGADIVNADSMQLYAGLRLLTARPSPAEEAAAPHHLFGVAAPEEAWSVGHWLTAAVRALDAIAARGRTAIVVGGTGLYFRALTRGLAEIPPVPPPIRQQAAGLWEAGGEPAVRERLAALDPAAEQRILSGDRQRLTRALEVVVATGRPISAWQASTASGPPQRDWRRVVVEIDRMELYQRCDRRLVAMIEGGALDEVADLLRRGLDQQLPAMKALGVEAFAAQLRGELSPPEALARVQAQTRQFAKRQLTWFRNQTADWERV